ncbi:hypothetical protein B0T26DRAFT_641195 [Lasiosphaeria miniovina]|uniref:DUF7053 domain-containing protein n=1 Tax=Lasiosphaeria miniovina TaxID=1954250 RepID=A0AA40E3W7_9PEZI|nr:uncharacterized protein B0T26DRAFT_641195 [Lasiosphaeria miniovina]KAK0721638.1 hypothetical protein B0T26DRAFT_641195 [Lasiosphaeria miniovina]
MLRKKDSFTLITPIPGFIPRQLAIDILHSHSEVITLNPLVLDHKPIAAPQNAETDEYYSTWYEITERITFMPGIGKMGASIIKFNGCFHDMPWGLQTHIYAPMNVDLRNTYRIAGNQPGFENPEVPEIGLKALGAPADGLYLREDIEIKCNITVLSFVKSQLKKAGGEMVQRIIKKAELLDAGVLQAMISDGKLKTVNPADRRNTVRSPLPSPMSLHYSPSISGTTTTATPPPPTQSPDVVYQIPRPQSAQPGQLAYRPGTAGSQPPRSGYSQQPAPFGYGTPNGPVEMAAAEPVSSLQFAVEMPGDFYHASSSLQPSPLPQQLQQQRPPSRPSSWQQQHPDLSLSGQWSSAPNSRPASTSSTGSGFQSPGLDNKFSSGLAPHQETFEEHRDDALKKLDPQNKQSPQHAPYNPADYAKGPPQPQYGRGQLAQRYNYAQ